MQTQNYEQNTDQSFLSNKFDTHDDDITIRKPDHFDPGTYVAGAALCSCSRVCVALIDDD